MKLTLLIEGTISMKYVEKNKARTRTTPIKITLTEAEILEDLHYPVPIDRIDARAKGVNRTRTR